MPRDTRTITNTSVDEIRQIIRRNELGCEFEKEKEIVECPICGNKYEKQRVWQKFCSVDCRNRWHEFRRRHGIR